MTLGIALLLIFVLYLIDKHNRWWQTLKILVGLVFLGILVTGGWFGWKKYDAYRTEKRTQAEASAFQARVKACIAKSTPVGNVTTPMIAPDGTLADIPNVKVQDAVKAGFKIGVEMTAPDGTKGVIPIERESEALKAGFSTFPKTVEAKCERDPDSPITLDFSKAQPIAVPTRPDGTIKNLKPLAMPSFPPGFVPDATLGDCNKNGCAVYFAGDKIAFIDRSEITKAQWKPVKDH